MSLESSDFVRRFHGALLIDKPAGISSFGIIEQIQKTMRARWGWKRSELPKMGHGGTLDPFATGLIVLGVGRGVKLSRYFLGSEKTYEGVFKFGETTASGDPTNEVTERCEQLPESRERLQILASQLCAQDYLQTPPMHSAKKVDGKRLYELARQGLEVEREARACRLTNFEIGALEGVHATFKVSCSSGTYIRTLAQDLGRLAGSLGMLESLRRTASGNFEVQDARPLSEILEIVGSGDWESLLVSRAFVPFREVMLRYPHAMATVTEAQMIRRGRQEALDGILSRSRDAQSRAPFLAIFEETAGSLVAVARKENHLWNLERVFSEEA